VDPLDQDQIADGLKALCSNHELRAKLIQAGANRAASYTWSRAAAESLAVYARLIRLP
jgi:glycosyltransferase involved in cell wall biosynthesis